MKIIFFDIDGTLYKAEDKAVRKEVIDALKEIRKKGVKTVVATGRSYIYIPKCIKELDMDGYICSNGSYIVMKDEILEEQFLEPEQMKQLIHYLDINHYEYDLQTRDKVYSKKTNTKLKKYQEYSEVSDDVIESKYDLETIQNKIHKINIHVDFDSLNELLKETAAFEKEVHLKTDHIELFVSGYTKGTGVNTVLKHIGISKEEAAAFGDSMNDVSMFNEVGFSIAMANADPRLKDMASTITDSVENCGVAKFLKKKIKRY